MEHRRITEQSNPLTERIDEVDIPGMLAQLHAAERQIFGSAEWGEGLFDPGFLDGAGALQRRIQSVLRDAHGRLFIGGAGTSGRLALHTAAIHGAVHGRGKIIGLLAGGMPAFRRAREGVEDSPEAGKADLRAHLVKGSPFVYIGVTCGLSAAYVAGQVATALESGAAAVAVIGFNPLEAAIGRALNVPGGSFRNLLRDLQTRESGFLLNPIIGPEPIRGSTRMKGGSATKIILDGLLAGADLCRYFQDARRLQEAFYRRTPVWTPLIAGAGRALSAGGRVIYLAGPREGLMALLDASECPPTFGAHIRQVMAFVDPEVSRLLPELGLSRHVPENFVPGENDAVFVLAQASPKGGMPFVAAKMARQDFHNVPLAGLSAGLGNVPTALVENYRDLSLKWLLNALSTCGFIQYGKVFGNRMIDLRISNLKLWDRAGEIVAELGGVSVARAAELLRTIIAGSHGEAMAIEKLISKAMTCEKVVPTAILMAREGLVRARAEAQLAAAPKLKDALLSPRSP